MIMVNSRIKIKKRERDIGNLSSFNSSGHFSSDWVLRMMLAEALNYVAFPRAPGGQAVVKCEQTSAPTWPVT